MIWRCNLEPQTQNYLGPLLDVTRRILLSGRYVLEKEVAEFEKAFAAYLHVDHCIGVANGTDALILALRSVGLKNGEEVITTPFTAIPTISAIVAAGGKPVFVDIDSDTYLIDIEQIPGAVTGNTRAIIPVHLFTQMVDINRLRANLRNRLPIIEDAAQAHGCSLNGVVAGTLGDLAAFSFYPTKNLGGYGDGGAVVTNNFEYANKVQLMRNYGKETQDCIVVDGVNSRLDALQAAYLRIKLQDLELMNEKRRTLAEIYRQKLKGLPILPPVIKEGAVPNYHVYVVKVLELRDELKIYLQEKGIQTDIFYPFPHSLQPAYQHLGYQRGDFPNAEQVGKQVLALPMYAELEENQIIYISDQIRSFFGVA